MITKETKVILPTLLKTEYKKKDGVIHPVYRYDKYEFTIEEALSYMAENTNRTYLFGEMMRYNLPLRQLIRSVGVEKAVGTVAAFAPDNEELHKEMTYFASRYKHMRLADYDVLVMPTSWSLKFFGHDNWQEYMVKAKRVGKHHECFDLSAKGDSPLQVGVLYDPYPCFDSYDAATEDRKYCNYIIRNRPITEDDFRKVEETGRDMNCCFSTEHLSPELLPIVYWDGDSGFRLVATKAEDMEIMRG